MYAFTRSLIRPGLFTRSARTFSTRPSNPPAPQLDDGEANIYHKLKEKFNPSELLVQDVSGGCGSFYAITIASDAFKGIPIVKQHRMVNDVLKKEFEGIHGLQLKTIPV
ncbi:bola-like protein [Neolentinus lepideus HHB14362 ss-1]|uniref:Bola-like protein n=1 Tax=Neolentinus lepideus HHB14362 ss-1 TaxID=1314782 RepID=A0A165TMG3_9AGAM|nr:bola-like protein [Neolentinus lepideus HHB14362 ss-1]